MENLCDSATNGGEGTYDVLSLPTEPKDEGRAKGKDGFKRLDNPNVRWFRAEKAKANKHTGSRKFGASAHQANLTSVEEYDYYYDEDMDESANAHQGPQRPT